MLQSGAFACAPRLRKRSSSDENNCFRRSSAAAGFSSVFVLERLAVCRTCRMQCVKRRVHAAALYESVPAAQKAALRPFVRRLRGGRGFKSLRNHKPKKTTTLSDGYTLAQMGLLCSSQARLLALRGCANCLCRKAGRSKSRTAAFCPPLTRRPRLQVPP